MGRTGLGNLDLGTAKGLETIQHRGPSSIGIDTIYRSKGRIPEVFLRGAGLPDDSIVFARSLLVNPTAYCSCFISYSTQDEKFADRLHEDLQGKGVRCWYAPHDLQGGKKLEEQIDQAIRVQERVLLILSIASMNSNWVKTEIAKARRREETERRQMLFPISLVRFDVLKNWESFDADIGIDSAKEIREYFIPDFSNWTDPASYEKAFQRLLRDLKPEKSAVL